MRPLEKTFGERVSDLLDQYQSRGKTAQDLADSLGVSRSTVYNYRKRETAPNSDAGEQTKKLLPRRERYEYREAPRRRFEKRQEQGFPDRPSIDEFIPRTQQDVQAVAGYIESGQPVAFIEYMEAGGEFTVDVVQYLGADDQLLIDFRENVPSGAEIVDNFTLTFEGYSDIEDFISDWWAKLFRRIYQ